MCLLRDFFCCLQVKVIIFYSYFHDIYTSHGVKFHTMLHSFLYECHIDSSHDERLLQKINKAVPPPVAPPQNATFHTPLQTQQFGVSLQFIKDNNNGEVIPPVVRECVEFLSQPEGELSPR